MKNNLFFLLLMVFALAALPAGAQTDSPDDEPPYRSQITYGINFNTNAGLIGGGVFRYSTAISDRMYHTFSVDIVNIRHPKEQRTQSRLSGESFVPGKQNYLFLIRPQYGREYILFRKAREQGVQINLIGSAGPTIAVIPPYLIEYRFGTGNIVLEQYDPERHPSFDAVLRTSRFGESMAQSRFGVGASARAALSFEFGSFKNNVTGFEVGVVGDMLAQRVIMMPLAENSRGYLSLYVTLFYGSRR